MGLTFKCLNLEYLCSVSPLYKYARLYADYAKILQHSFKSVLLLNQCYMVVTYLKIVLDCGEKNLLLNLRSSANGTRGTGGALCVEWDFLRTFPGNRDAAVKEKSEIIFIKFW